ncbi:MAG: metallophosphoesterase [Actinomycetota bacterium]|nr:metallophosphoesterase [Actinomycetota bacterium]
MWGLLRLVRRRLNRPGAPADLPTFTPAAELGDEWRRVAVVGDVGHPSPELDATVAALVRASTERPFDALVLLGDNVYPDGQPALLQQAVLDPFAALLDAGVAPLAVLGNHDVQAGQGDEIAKRLGMPGRWYATTVGPSLFIALDSTQPNNPTQRAWLAATLAEARASWVVVALHHPPYSAGWHGSHRRARRAFVPLFRRFGVDVVLAGHDHDYQRSKPLAGITYVISGAAAHQRATGRAGFTAASHADHHFVDLRISPERLELVAVDHGGVAFDGVVTTKRKNRVTVGGRDVSHIDGWRDAPPETRGDVGG